mgnify:CR=1 FL=1
MSNTLHKDFACLISILESIEKIEGYTKSYENADDFYADSISFDATMMNFIVIGEMADKISEEFKANTQDKVDWFKIRGFRRLLLIFVFFLAKYF